MEPDDPAVQSFSTATRSISTLQIAIAPSGLRELAQGGEMLFDTGDKLLVVTVVLQDPKDEAQRDAIVAAAQVVAFDWEDGNAVGNKVTLDNLFAAVRELEKR